MLLTKCSQSSFMSNVSFLQLDLSLVLVESINLFSHLRHSVVMLLTKCSQSSFMSNVSFLQFTLKFTQLSFSLLVELDLCRGVGASFLQTTSQVLDIARQSSSVLISLGSVLTLNEELLIKFFNSRPELLNLFIVLVTESAFILNLSRHGSKLLLFTLYSSNQVSLDSVKISDSLLGQLQVSLNLPL